MRVTKNCFPGTCSAQGITGIVTPTTTKPEPLGSKEGSVIVAGGFYAGNGGIDSAYYGDAASLPTEGTKVAIGTLRTDTQAAQIEELKTIGWVEVASWDGMYQTAVNKYRIIMMAKGSSLKLAAAPTIRKRAVKAIRSLRKGGK